MVSTSDNRWFRNKNGNVFFSVVSRGLIGRSWLRDLKEGGIRVEYAAGACLVSSHFESMPDGQTTEIVVINANLFGDRERMNSNILAFAVDANLVIPPMEVACLIRKDFSDKEINLMGFNYVVVMHKPITGLVGGPGFFVISPPSSLTLHQESGGFDNKKWPDDVGVAFVAPEVDSSD